jgi:hypothetical protein
MPKGHELTRSSKEQRPFRPPFTRLLEILA